MIVGLGVLTNAIITSQGCIGREVDGHPDRHITKHLDSLRASSKEHWANKDFTYALLELEHACALVVAKDIVEEGAHDYEIGKRVKQLWDMGEFDTLRFILSHAPHFPQTSGWIRIWYEDLADRPEDERDVDLDRRRQLHHELEKLDERLKAFLRNRGN